MLLYLLSGGSAACVELATFSWLIARLHNAIMCSAMAILFAVLTNYVMSSLIVFHRPMSLHRFMLFIAGASVGLCVNCATTLIDIMTLGLEPPLAKLAGIIIAFSVNYAINSRLVFAGSTQEEAA